MPEVGRLTHKCTESRQQQTDSISWPRNFKQPNIHIKRYYKIVNKRTVCFLKKEKIYRRTRSVIFGHIQTQR